MKEFRPPEEPALCADSSAGVPLVYSLTFSWSNRSIEMSILALITAIPATPSRRLVFRLRTRHIESPSGLRGIVYLLRRDLPVQLRDGVVQVLVQSSRYIYHG